MSYEKDNVDYDEKDNKTDQIKSAATVRSSLAELEIQATHTLQKLENIRLNCDATTENPVVKFPPTLVLQSERRAPADILTSLEVLISTPDEDNIEFPLPALDDVSLLSLISHSVVAYLTHLDRNQLIRVIQRIAGDTSRWLGNIFHFFEPTASFHSDNAEATLRVLRLAIVSRCPGYLEGGIPVLANPCVYISENTTPVRLQFACRELGIPLDAIRSIPTTPSGCMDLLQLQKQIQNDLSANRNPLMIIADVGQSLCGFTDNLIKLKEICKINNIWLHASGHSIASLAAVQGPGSVSTLVDSIVLNLGSWLGIPSLPIVLLHRQLQNVAISVFDSDPILSKRLNSLSLWTSLQALGRENISEKIDVAFQTCGILYEITLKCDGIRILSRAASAPNGFNISELVNKPLEPNALFEAASPVVVFQFDGSNSTPISVENTSGDQNQDITQAIINKSIEKVSNAAYFDGLNAWLGQIMQRDCPNFDFEIIEHQLHGTCIRYCPLELELGESPPTSENLENFATTLESHVDILRATIKHKATFNKLVEKSEVLRLVQMPDWAGLGGVRFVPEGWETLLTDQAKTELNKLNIDLVESLKSTDNAFSMGEGSDGLVCVRFGMVTHETDVEELLDLVIQVGKSVQENSKVLDSMSEIVKKGIEAATMDLQKESDEKLWQEGILRHVPVVGRMYNWWSPAPKESGIKGRSLNLTQGVIESTENIYKYHMQMSNNSTQLPGNKSPPPPPMVQTQISQTSTGHSRTVSQSSNTSAQDTQIAPQN